MIDWLGLVFVFLGIGLTGIGNSLFYRQGFCSRKEEDESRNRKKQSYFIFVSVQREVIFVFPIL